MRNWRTLFVVGLLAVPLLVVLVCAAVALWKIGWWWWLWWILPVFWGLAYLLARRWQDSMHPPPDAEPPPTKHWTPRDQEALAIIKSQQEAVRDVAPQRLTEPQFYHDTAMQLGLQIARHYHPRAPDPVSSLTVPEILAVTHLACEDLERWVQDYVPASHLLSVSHWRTLAKAPGWFQSLSNLTWAVAVLIQPTNIARYAASKFAMQSASKRVQANVLAWFYIAFVRHVGFYLIEMNSGRLRGGAARYRETMDHLRGRSAESTVGPLKEAGEKADSASLDDQAVEVTIAVVGQVNAGKSSFVNALLGKQAAATDILPRTRSVQRHQLELADVQERLVLLDTAGYGAGGDDEDHESDNRIAYRNSDLILLLMNASNPAREADVRMLQRMHDWFARDLQRRPPPILGILTHIDLLRPVMQWSPPYDWQNPSSEKESSIRAATDYHAQLLGDRLAGIVPVCSDVERQRCYGVHEFALPAMTVLLDEARACSLIRTLHQDLDRGRAQRVFGQLGRAGMQILKSCLDPDRAANSQS